MKTVQQIEQFWLKRKASGAMWDYTGALPKLARHFGASLKVLKKMISDGTIPVRHVVMGDECFNVLMSEDVVEAVKGLSDNN